MNHNKLEIQKTPEKDPDIDLYMRRTDTTKPQKTSEWVINPWTSFLVLAPYVKSVGPHV